MLLWFPEAVRAQDEAEVERRAAQIVDVIRGQQAYDEVFAPPFVAAVPQAQFAALAAQMGAQMGPFVGLESVEHAGTPGAATISLRFRDAIASGPMQLESAPPYRVAGLLLNAFRPVNDAGQSALDLVRELPGTSSVWFARVDGSEVIAAHQADRQLALGSTFKLYVLSALVRSIGRGEHRWDEVVPLDQHSYPSGQLQDWPAGTPLTLQSLATLMIAISDNTATDQLIAVLGREAVEAELLATGHSAPMLNRPFLTTRQLFLLKLADDARLDAYAAGDAHSRQAILDGLPAELPDASLIQSVFAGGPRGIDVEWFGSGQDIGRVMAELARDPVARGILAVNRGMAASHFAGWDYAGFKGGSEPGVLNLSWLLRDEAGDYWVLSLAWNNADEPVSEVRLLGLAQQLLAEARRP